MDGVSDDIFGHQLAASAGVHSISERLSSAEIITHVSLGSGRTKLMITAERRFRHSEDLLYMSTALLQ
jgi:hypothetical protein